MTELGAIFSRLGLEQYLNVFLTEGFETWGTVLDITESDLDALGVKLGHRRRLQREIANSRLYEANLSPGGDGRDGNSDENAYFGASGGKTPASPAEKRKYQRHPKADKYAPERPSSAYVIFSNKLREELKVQRLTFTEIAKKVGESWQKLVSEEKERYEMQALSAKEKYHAELIKYKKTDNYQEYAKYLADFKAKNAATSDGKRRKLKIEASNTKAASGRNPDTNDASTRRTSAGSMARENKDNSSNSGASYPLGHAVLRSGSAPIAMAPPFLLASHGSQWAPMSPKRVSPTRGVGRRDYSTTAPLPVARAHQVGEQAVDRSAGLPLSQAHPTPYEHANPRGSSPSPFEPLNDPACQSGHHGPQLNLLCSNPPASAPCMSSTLSSSAATASSTYVVMGSMDDARSQKALPPISTVGLEPLANTAFSTSGGPPNFSSPTYVSNSHTFTHPSHPSFLPSSSSGRQHSTRNSGGGVGSCDSGVANTSVADGSEVMIDPRLDGRSGQDTLRLHPGPQRPLPTPASSDAERSPMDKQSSNHENFPTCEVDALSVLALAGRLVDGGAGYQV